MEARLAAAAENLRAFGEGSVAAIGQPADLVTCLGRLTAFYVALKLWFALLHRVDNVVTGPGKRAKAKPK